MSEFVAPGGQRFALFGRGGGATLAAEIGAPLVASIPLEPEVSTGGDTGRPIALASPDSGVELGYVPSESSAAFTATVFGGAGNDQDLVGSQFGTATVYGGDVGTAI